MLHYLKHKWLQLDGGNYSFPSASLFSSVALYIWPRKARWNAGCEGAHNGDPKIISREPMREDRLLLLQAEEDASREEQKEKRRDGDELGWEEFDEVCELKMVEEFKLFLGFPFHDGRGESLLRSSGSFSVKNCLWILVDDRLDSRKTSSFMSMLEGLLIWSL